MPSQYGQASYELPIRDNTSPYGFGDSHGRSSSRELDAKIQDAMKGRAYNILSNRVMPGYSSSPTLGRKYGSALKAMEKNVELSGLFSLGNSSGRGNSDMNGSGIGGARNYNYY